MKKGLMAALAWIVLLCVFSIPASVAAPGNLGADLSVQVKNLTVERTEQGSRIIAVIRLTNEGREAVRAPEYEVRAITTDNIVYALQPSADNPVTIHPLETAELYYSLLVKRFDIFTITQLSWVQMNKNVYPRTETTVLSLAVTQNKMESRTWGQSFVLPPGPAQITLTPVKLLQQTFLDGTGFLIAFRAENIGSAPYFVPDFLVEGQTNVKKYDAARTSAASRTPLEPGETRWIYYQLQVDRGEELRSLAIMTQESFRDAGANLISYRPAWLRIFIPSHLIKTTALDDLPSYRRGEVIPLEPDSQLMPAEVEISLTQLGVKPWTSNGLRAMVAEITIVNRGPVPLPKPEFAVELMSSEGRRYLGTLMPKEPPVFKFESEPDMDRTGAINPNVPYTVSYEFHLPIAEIGREIGVLLSDSKSQPPFRIPAAALRTTVSAP